MKPTVQVTSTQAAGLPTLNSYQIGWWRQKAFDLGLSPKGTKRDLYTRIMLHLRAADRRADHGVSND